LERSCAGTVIHNTGRVLVARQFDCDNYALFSAWCNVGSTCVCQNHSK